MKRILLYALLVLLLAGGVFVTKLIWGRPFNFDHLLERYLIAFVKDQPEILTLVGAIENTALDFHSDKLSDASPEATARSYEQAMGYLAKVRSYDRAKLTPQQQISYDMMVWYLGMVQEGEPFLYHDFPVNQVSGLQADLPSFMTSYHVIKDKKSAERYIARLKAFRTKIGQIGASVTYRAERGIVPPRFVFDHVIRDMEAFIAPDPGGNTLYTTFVSKLDSTEVSDAEKVALKAEALATVGGDVYDAYRQLIVVMRELYPMAKAEAGAWTLPDGDAYYRYMTRQHTSLDVSPEEIHDIGLAGVARITNEMNALFNRIGIMRGNVAERFKSLDARPGTFYPDTSASIPVIIADYQAMVDKLLEGTRPLFKRVPQAACEVRRVPEHSQATAPFAYYMFPALDGSRPGIFYINLRDIGEIPTYGMMTLTAHEAIPGHHFQLALAQEIQGVPTVRRMLPFNAYAEGWALYTEGLVAEIGMYADDPESDLGRLQAEMFRAVRLVVDTGIHLKRWTREQAIAYMLEHTGMPEGDVVAEIERYIVWPGQALGYKMGMIHIQNLRAKAEAELGEAFDLADFHDTVLMNGSLPMTVLDTVVDGYITSRSRTPIK